MSNEWMRVRSEDDGRGRAASGDRSENAGNRCDVERGRDTSDTRITTHGQTRRAATRRTVSPVIAARGGGKEWDINISNAGAYDHRVVLTWDNDRKTGEGMAVYQPSTDGSKARIVLRGTLGAEGGDKDMAIELLEQDCTGDDGVAHEHGINVTISGMPPMHGCADLAI